MLSSGKIFADLKRMRELLELFGRIDAFTSPLIPVMENHSVRKMTYLIEEKVECRITDPKKRKRHDRAMSREIVSSDCIGEAVLGKYAEIVLMLKSYLRAKNIKAGLPRVAEGIGICFLGHLDEYNGILQRLLEFSRPERNRLMEGVKINYKFFEHYLGQFIYTHFQVHAPKLPRPPYGMIRP